MGEGFITTRWESDDDDDDDEDDDEEEEEEEEEEKDEEEGEDDEDEENSDGGACSSSWSPLAPTTIDPGGKTTREFRSGSNGVLELTEEVAENGAEDEEDEEGGADEVKE